MAEKSFILRMSEADHKSIKRRALNAGVTMRRYITEVVLYGKVQHKKPK